MDVAQPIRVKASGLVEGGVVVVFSDGEEAYYPAALLHSMLPQATRIHVKDEGDE